MKKLGIYIVATASCFFSSCLDTELYTTIPVDDFFKTEADAQAYLNGVYGGFRDRSARCYIPAGEYAYQMLNEVAGANLIFGRSWCQRSKPQEPSAGIARRGCRQSG